MKKHTEGVIDEIGKNWAGVATRLSKINDILTLGFYPKPNYEQIGTYKGDVSNLKRGDRVVVTFKTKEEESWVDKYTPFGNNISKLEKLGVNHS